MLPVYEHALDLTSAKFLSDPRLSQWVHYEVDVWLFEGVQARQRLASTLEQQGVRAKIRSAYKPLLCAFLEDVDASNLVSVHIEYPVHVCADPRRFLLEAYPLESVMPEVALSWAAQRDVVVTAQPAYQVTLTDRSGASQVCSVLAPNVLKNDATLGVQALCPTGYLRVTDPVSQKVIYAESFQTEFEQAFQRIMQWVLQHPWGDTEPYFERLVLRVELPGTETFDTQGQLILSTYEALHEDLYFAVLEFFQLYSKRPSGDRGLQPGQIVPDIRVGFDQVRIKINKYPVGAALPALEKEYQRDGESVADTLSSCQAPISATEIRHVLKSIEAQTFEFQSRQGRVVDGLHRLGTLPAIVVTGGQHANEASGVVGALRGARWLATQPQAHFAVVPLENPDGYALFAQYRSIHPQHMHHAARYTGLGDDLEYREQAPWFEAEGRRRAIALTGAQLHVSLHGYPAHEWTRPLTGYVPRGFSSWSIPKGFFLIVRYQAQFKALALHWLEALTQDLSQVSGLADFNRRQMMRYESYAGLGDFDMKHGIACMLSQNDRQSVGVKLVTEFPDETIYGAAFEFAQHVQTETVRLAATHWWRLYPPV
jgi:hypothetical protein